MTTRTHQECSECDAGASHANDLTLMQFMNETGWKCMPSLAGNRWMCPVCAAYEREADNDRIATFAAALSDADAAELEVGA